MDEIRYQVFVSSTYTDLKEEREKVLQAILQLRSFPAGMELFPAADEEQFEFIKREIDSSDYYILIIGGRYGSMDENGVSFTEKEYDYARSVRKPTLAFIVKDVGKLIGDKLENDDGSRRKLAAFTEKAKKSKLVNFYSNADELKSEVLYSLPSQFSLRPMRGWIRAGQQSRQQLEETASLQRKVLSLSEENQRLQSLKAGAESILANGSDLITWSLDLNSLSFDNKYPPNRSMELATTWDDVLQTIFSEGSSQVTRDQVQRRLVRFIIETYPNDPAATPWKEAATGVMVTWSSMPKFPVVEQIITDVLRQFNGLGLIEESKETLYEKDKFSSQNLISSVDVWKLTPNGRRQLAIAQGHKKLP